MRVDVKRYDFFVDYADGMYQSDMAERADGRYVLFSEYEPLLVAMRKVLELATRRELTCSNGDYQAFVRIATDALTPEAPRPDATLDVEASRKVKD